MQPSMDEAFRAIPDLLYVIDQCMAYHVWLQSVKPVLEGRDQFLSDRSAVQIVENSTIESALIFLRKLNEFFGKRPQNPGDDALRAYHFGDFPDNGWFLTKAEFDELHIRVGHISVEEVRYGKKNWPIHDYLRRALLKACSFLTFLAQSSDLDQATAEGLLQRAQDLRSIIGEA